VSVPFHIYQSIYKLWAFQTRSSESYSLSPPSRFTMTATMERDYVTDVSLDGLKPFSLSSAVPCQYRFVDTKHFMKDARLSVLAMPELPSVPYAAVSHVWRVLKSIPPTEKAIEVKGIEEYPKIPTGLLKTICIAASTQNCTLLWLDKLCVRQDNYSSQDGKKDNEWQVEQMHNIYSKCSVCLVVPGGLGRLSSLDVKTIWLDRSWTLQEALAPPVVMIIFEWDKGNAILQHNASVILQEIVPGKVAVAHLKALLEASLKAEVKLVRETHDKDWDDNPSQMVIELLSWHFWEPLTTRTKKAV